MALSIWIHILFFILVLVEVFRFVGFGQGEAAANVGKGLWNSITSKGGGKSKEDQEEERERKKVDKEEKEKGELSGIEEHEEKLRNIRDAYRGVRRKYTKAEIGNLEELAAHLRTLFENVRELEELKKQVQTPAVKQRIERLIGDYRTLVASINKDINKILDDLIKQKRTLRENIRKEIQLKHAVIREKKLVNEMKKLDEAAIKEAVKNNKELAKEEKEVRRALEEFNGLVKLERTGEKREIRIFRGEADVVADEIKRVQDLQRAMSSAEKRVLPSSKIENLYKEVEGIYGENKDTWGKEHDEELIAEKEKQIRQHEQELLAKIKGFLAKARRSAPRPAASRRTSGT